MKLHALIAAAACAVSLFAGIWHLMVFRRGTRQPTQLTFGLACFAIAFFDVCRIGNHLTFGVQWSKRCQLGEQLAGALLAIPLAWYIVLIRRDRMYWFAYSVSAYFATVALVILVSPMRWLLTDAPRITRFQLPWGSPVTYWELQHGPLLAAIANVSCVVILGVVVVLALPLRGNANKPDRSQIQLIRIGMTVFLLGALNDIAVSLQLYQFFYLMEVAYLGLILVVTWGMSNSVIELASARAELRRKHVRLQRIFENVNEVYFETTLDGTIREISPSIQRVAGLSPDLHGQSILAYYTDVSKREELLKRLKLQGKVTDFETKLRTANGEIRDTEISAALNLDEVTGEPLVQGSIRDVTARKRAEAAKALLERQLQQAQKLESLGVLAGGIAHDFNNILAGILGSTQLAKLKLGDAHPANELLDLTLESSQRAAELCRLMLAYSGRAHFAIEALDLSHLVRGLRELLFVTVSKKTRLEFDLSPDGVVVEADAAQLNQVLLNLVINAAEAVASGNGWVRIATYRQLVSAEELRSEFTREPPPGGSFGILEVSDNGIGMDAETKQRLFEPFFTTKFSGRGLGLSAVLGIVRAHRGTIQIQSALGEGSTFRVYFPLCVEPTRNGSTESLEDATWRGSGEALIIDDEPALCRTTAEMLGELGYRATVSTDPEAAVVQFSRTPQRFRFVIVDVTMPVLSGDQVVTRLREIRPDLPVVYMSGFCEEDVLPERTKIGSDAFLQKPFGLGALRSCIRGMFQGQLTPPND